MHLNENDIKNVHVWLDAGIKLPRFDREKMRKATKEKPEWVHFGCGNIFRAFHSALAQKALENGDIDTGIIVAEGYDYEIVDLISRPHDDLTLVVTLKADGNINKDVIGSISESLKLDSNDEKDFGRLKEIFRAPSLQICTFTITEKGYVIHDASGKYLSDIEKDMKTGPAHPDSYIGKVTALCYERYKAGKLPVAMISTDNCSHNGDKLHDAIFAFADEWERSNLVDEGFCDYIENPELVSFPWSMIDKITPRPDEGVKAMLLECGFEDVYDVCTTKKTFVAPFVNAEETQYLIVEDHFPNGHPNIENTGVIFTTRETVDKVERMKVCTCLNPLHTALAVFGCLLGYTKISAEMADEDLKRLVNIIGYNEGLPVVVNPGILDPKSFLDTVLEKRFPNPFMPDTPQRIATDTSQKLGIRFGETIKAYLQSETLNINNLRCIPMVQAAWCRYLMGMDDEGQPMEVSPDPLYETLSRPFKSIRLGDQPDVHRLLEPILSNASIFGLSLYEAGLGALVEEYFRKFISSRGAVREVLHEVVTGIK